MTPDEFTPVIACTLAEATHVAPAAFGGRLLLPRDGNSKMAALDFFLSRRQRLAGRLRSLTSRQGDRAYRLHPDFLKAVAPMADGRDVAVALGTPGPLNKSSFAIVDRNGRVDAVGKIATRMATVALVRNEALWLSRCAAVPELARHVPKLIASIDAGGSAEILVQSAVGGSRPGLRPTLPHAAFLRLLQASGPVAALPLRDTAMGETLARHLALVAHSVPAVWSDRYERGMARITGYPEPVLVGPAHRDFTPWNTRLEGGALQVFDWEYASDGYGAAYDLLHCRLLPQVLRGSRIRLDAVLRDTAALAAAAGMAGLSGDQLHVQVIAYFLDICLFYMASRGGWTTDDKVTEGYGPLLDQLLAMQ